MSIARAAGDELALAPADCASQASNALPIRLLPSVKTLRGAAAASRSVHT